jgi:hypothetical protein
MRLRRDKTGDAVGRPRRESSLLGDPAAKFFCENGGQAQKRRNRQKRKKPRGQDFFQAAVQPKKGLSEEWSAPQTIVRSGVLMAGFEVTTNGRF